MQRAKHISYKGLRQELVFEVFAGNNYVSVKSAG